MTSISEILEGLFAYRAPALPPEALAEVYCRLIWCFSDNGAEVTKMQRRWMQGSDFEKVKIALCMDEVVPFTSREEMDVVLNRICQQWPELAAKCHEYKIRMT